MTDLTVYRVEHRFCRSQEWRPWHDQHPYHGPAGASPSECRRSLDFTFGHAGPTSPYDSPGVYADVEEIFGGTRDQIAGWWSSDMSMSTALRAAADGWRLVEYRVPEENARVLTTQTLFDHAAATEVAIHGLLHFDPEPGKWDQWRRETDNERYGWTDWDDVEEVRCECAACCAFRDQPAEDQDRAAARVESLFQEAVEAGVSPTILFPEDGFDAEERLAEKEEAFKATFADAVNEAMNRRAA